MLHTNLSLKLVNGLRLLTETTCTFHLSSLLPLYSMKCLLLFLFLLSLLSYYFLYKFYDAFPTTNTFRNSFATGKKILVLGILGPQSSGKTTLLNFMFGTSLSAAKVRTTKVFFFTIETPQMIYTH